MVNVLLILTFKHVLERKTGTSLSLANSGAAASQDSQTTTEKETTEASSTVSKVCAT